MVVLILLTVLMAINAETLGPGAEREARALTTRAISRNLIAAQWTGIWAREGDVFINAKQGTLREAGQISPVELGDVRRFEFSPEVRAEGRRGGKEGVSKGRFW